MSSQNKQEGYSKGVTGGYNNPLTAMESDGNLIKLKAIIVMFGLGLSDVAKAGKVSRPYVSRVLSQNLKASPRFLRHLEANLHTLIEKRDGQVFSIAVTPVDETVRMQSFSSKPIERHSLTKLLQET